jgi:hypothetical protein
MAKENFDLRLQEGRDLANQMVQKAKFGPVNATSLFCAGLWISVIALHQSNQRTRTEEEGTIDEAPKIIRFCLRLIRTKRGEEVDVPRIILPH